MERQENRPKRRILIYIMTTCLLLTRFFGLTASE